jgi:hypothetical protein
MAPFGRLRPIASHKPLHEFPKSRPFRTLVCFSGIPEFTNRYLDPPTRTETRASWRSAKLGLETNRHCDRIAYIAISVKHVFKPRHIHNKPLLTHGASLEDARGNAVACGQMDGAENLSQISTMPETLAYYAFRREPMDYFLKPALATPWRVTL